MARDLGRSSNVARRTRYRRIGIARRRRHLTLRRRRAEAEEVTEGRWTRLRGLLLNRRPPRCGLGRRERSGRARRIWIGCTAIRCGRRHRRVALGLLAADFAAWPGIVI